MPRSARRSSRSLRRARRSRCRTRRDRSRCRRTPRRRGTDKLVSRALLLVLAEYFDQLVILAVLVGLRACRTAAGALLLERELQVLVLRRDDRLRQRVVTVRAERQHDLRFAAIELDRSRRRTDDLRAEEHLGTVGHAGDVDDDRLGLLRRGV